MADKDNEQHHLWFPDEILFYIFGFLTPAKHRKVALVCKQWFHIAHDANLKGAQRSPTSCGTTISVHVGKAGLTLGCKFWEALMKEHRINNYGEYIGFHPKRELTMIHSFFDDTLRGKLLPKAVMVSLSDGAVQCVKQTPCGMLIRPDNFIFSAPGAGGNWAKGAYTEGAEIMDSALDCIRREAESCDNLHAVQLMHSTGGGTGSQIGSLLLSKIREEYPTLMSVSHSVMPSSHMSGVTEPYNWGLSLHQLAENADLVFCHDNDELLKEFKGKDVRYDELNRVAASLMSGVTSSLRFPATTVNLNDNYRKMTINLVPFPRLHFVTVHNTSLNPAADEGCWLPPSLLKSSMPSPAPMNTVNMFGGVANFRGKVPLGGMNEWGRVLSEQHEWAYSPPDALKYSTFKSPIFCEERGSSVVSVALNSSGVCHMMKRLLGQYSSMLARGAFLHWYTGEGMDQMEFTEAESNINDLIAGYEQQH